MGLIAVAGAASPSLAETSPVYLSATAIADEVARSAARFAKGSGATVITPLLSAGALHADLEYRQHPSADVHAHDADTELVVVVQGRGTMAVGGTLIDPVSRDGTSRARTAPGAEPVALAPGDVLLLPAKLPHAVTAVDGKLALLTMHLTQPMPNSTPRTDTPWIEREFTQPTGVPVGAIEHFLNEECRPADLDGIQTVAVQKGHDDAAHIHVYCRHDVAAAAPFRVSMTSAPERQAFAGVNALAAKPRTKLGPFYFGQHGAPDGIMVIEQGSDR